MSDATPGRKRQRLSTEARQRREKQRAEAATTSSSSHSNSSSGSTPIQDNSRGKATTTAILVFLGSLIGSLIGTFASLNDMLESFDAISELANPPPRLCIAGSSTILGDGLGMAEEWEVYFENQTAADVFVNSTGSIGGVNSASDGGCVDVLAMSEAMTVEHEQQLINSGVEIQCAAEIGYDIIAFVTDIDNELPVIEDRFMRNILQGQDTNWADVRGDDQTIYIYARPGSGTTDYVLKRYGWEFGESQMPPDANYIECSSNSDCLNKTLGTIGSLYWVSLSWMKTRPEEYLRVLPVLQGDERPINPIRDNFNIRDYPNKLIRPLYMYVLRNSNQSDESNRLAHQFLDYVRGVEGQSVLEDHHFYTHFNRPIRVPLEFPTGFETDITQGPRQFCK